MPSQETEPTGSKGIAMNLARFLALAFLAAAPGMAAADQFTAIGTLAAYGSATAAAAGAGGAFWGLGAATWFYVGVAASACGSRLTKARTRRLGVRP